MMERIQKVLANAGIASRRASEDLVREGRVEVNGKVRRDLPVLVDSAVDEIRVDGERIGEAGRHAEHIPDRAKIGEALVDEAQEGDRIVVMGARDDTLIDFARELVERLGSSSLGA